MNNVGLLAWLPIKSFEVGVVLLLGLLVWALFDWMREAIKQRRTRRNHPNSKS
jgi:hypothetical protein